MRLRTERDCLSQKGLPSCLSNTLQKMWLLAHALGYHQIKLGYCGGVSSDHSRCHQLTLDEIAVAGVLCISPLLTLAQHLQIYYACHAIRLITDPHYFVEQIQPPVQPDHLKLSTAEKWRGHLEQLAGWHVVRSVTRVCVSYVQKYFAVAKSCGTLARAIFNGRAFSSVTPKPRSVNLPDMAELLQVLSIAFRGKKFSFMCADWRHWFFQFPLHRDIQKFFGIRLLAQYFLMCVLPMGWSQSPVIAQSTGWLIILEALRRCKVDIEPFKGQVQLPPYLHTVHGGAVIVVALWYDNVGCFASSENFTMQFAKQFKAVCSDFNVNNKGIIYISAVGA